MNADPRNLVDVTDALEQDIRAATDEFLLVSRGSTSHATLHLPADDSGTRPLCGRNVQKRDPDEDYQYSGWKRKPVAVYPPGHKPICRYCATEWRDKHD